MNNEFLNVDYDPESGVMPVLSREQFSYISSCLEDYHSVFNIIWNFGTINFRKIDEGVACVRFNKKEDYAVVDFCFDPEFWNNSSLDVKIFFILHESLHIINQHNIRCKNNKDFKLWNIATDITINHIVVNRFGFSREIIPDYKKFCWVDTVFDEIVPDDKCAEYYMSKLKDDNIDPIQITIDKHNFGENLDSTNEEKEIAEAFLKQVNETLTDKDKEEIKDILENGSQAGDTVGNKVWTFGEEKQTQKKTWNVLLKHLYRYARKHQNNDVVWTKRYRKYSLISKGLFLPGGKDMEINSKFHPETWFFLDTSGSCESFANRFWDVVQTAHRKFFKKEMFTFDTKVYPINVKTGRLEGGGGTSFSAIEGYIQHKIKEGEKYPDIICVITDGVGDNVQPQYPARWNWLITNDGYTSYCPKQSQIYGLEDFE